MARKPDFSPIRQAVSREEFGNAQLLWNDCVAALAEELTSGSLTEDMLKEVGALVEWSRSVVQCERAHSLDQLNRLHVAGEYELPVPTPAQRMVEASF